MYYTSRPGGRGLVRHSPFIRIDPDEIADVANSSDTLAILHGTAISDAGAATESLLSILSSYVIEVAQIAASLTGALVTSDVIIDEAIIRSAILTSVDTQLSDSAASTETLVGQLALLNEIIEALTTASSTTPTLAITSVAASIATVVDLLVPGVDVTATDAASLSEALSAKLALYLALAETAQLADSSSGDLMLFVSPSETATFTEAVSPTLVLIGLLGDGAEIAISLNFGGVSYVAYALNAETGAISEYSNFPFNAVAQFNGKTYAAADSGLYELTGDTDAGTSINASVRYGLTDFGNDSQKRIQSAALGITSDNQMVLKAIYVDGGKKRESWYLLKSQTADSFREGVIHIGQGLMSRYWGFEIHNVGGGDFEMDSIKLYPVVLSRRR